MTDPRQPAWDAVFAYIRTLPLEPHRPTAVERNAMIWRAVNAALTAVGYQDAYARIIEEINMIDPQQCPPQPTPEPDYQVRERGEGVSVEWANDFPTEGNYE